MTDISIGSVSQRASNSSRAMIPPQGAGVADITVASKQSSGVDYSKRVSNLKGLVDLDRGVFVLQQREGSTGEVKNEFPSKQVVAAYKRSVAQEEVKQALVKSEVFNRQSNDAATSSVGVSSVKAAEAPSGVKADAKATDPDPAPAPKSTSLDV